MLPNILALEKALKASARGRTAPEASRLVTADTLDAVEEKTTTHQTPRPDSSSTNLLARYRTAKKRMAELAAHKVKACWRQPWENLRDEFLQIRQNDAALAIAPGALFRAAASQEALARCSHQTVDYRRALKLYEMLPHDYPHSPLGDDALLQSARIMAHLKQPAEALAVLAKLQRVYPQGDMFSAARALSEELQTKIPAAAPPKGPPPELQVLSWDSPDKNSVEIVLEMSAPARYTTRLVKGEKGESARLYLDLEEGSVVSDVRKGVRIQGSLLQAVQVHDRDNGGASLQFDFRDVERYDVTMEDEPCRIILSVAASKTPLPQRRNAADLAEHKPMAPDPAASIRAAAQREAEARARAEAMAQAETEARLKAEARARDAAEAKARAMAEAAAAAETEARLKAEAKARDAAAAKAKADAEAKAEAKARAEAQAQAETEARLRAESRAREAAEARARAEAKARAETEALQKAEDEARAAAAAKARAEARAREATEALRKAEAEARNAAQAKARAEARAAAASEAKRKAEAKARAEAAARAEAEAMAAAARNARAPERLAGMASQLGLSVQTIFIDAGHGGRDPGTSHNRILERSITLDVALTLGRLLKANGLDIVYSRTVDKAVPLSERTRMANDARADLFVSIHINANEDTRIHGLETYYLDFTDNPEAARVAALENTVSDRRLGDMQSMLADVMLTARVDESRRLARDIQRLIMFRLKRRDFVIRNNGVRSAPFHVLIGAQMPAVLVELGYCTNKEEARRLADTKYRQALAEGLAEGILAYKDRLQRRRTAQNALTPGRPGAM
ncbi:MAG: N-acetylmuramoyl-L-alanine amidase [Desulfovibrio sp.]|nr:N-acetylmuramoyl-L-alanine amidase [Desulfovibrio sp.]